MNITSAQYVKDSQNNIKCVNATINGQEWSVPIDLTNSDYAEIMRQVEAGELEIQPADEG